MTPSQFVEALERHCRDAAASDTVEMMRAPPGRKPSASLVELSEWYMSLGQEHRVMVARVAQLAAHQCLFGVLCALDGARPVFSADISLKVIVNEGASATICRRVKRSWCITIGSSDRGGCIFGEPGRGSMIRINWLRFESSQPRVAQPHR
jgi:hypothetical protein